MTSLLNRATRVDVIAGQIYIGHKQGEWQCAKEERDHALLDGDDAGYDRYNAMMDLLSADLDALEEAA